MTNSGTNTSWVGNHFEIPVPGRKSAFRNKAKFWEQLSVKAQKIYFYLIYSQNLLNGTEPAPKTWFEKFQTILKISKISRSNFNVLLTVHLSIILATDQLNAQILVL